MFTGIIEELGEVLAWDRSGDAARITVRAPLAVSDAGARRLDLGRRRLPHRRRPGPDWFTADVMARDDRDASTLGDVAVGERVNLERAAAVGDRLGGHIVQGHIDGTAHGARDHRRGAPGASCASALARELAPLVTRKGSIAVDGVSLTSAVSDR